MRAPEGLVKRKLRNGRPGIRVVRSRLLYTTDSISEWYLELACGHRIERHRRYIGSHKEPVFAGCAECEPRMPKDLP